MHEPWKHISEVTSEVETYIDKRRKGEIKSLRTGYPKLDAANIGGFEWGSTVTIGARPGGGKCLGRGTRVLMFDGSTKSVEYIKSGDLVMGPDSSSRRVLGTTSGKDKMYKITQRNGITYRVNSHHFISLKRGKTELNKKHGSIINVSVSDYMLWAKSTKQRYKGYMSSCIHFPETSVPIDPYLLGVWLGDGSSRGPLIHSGDKEIIDYCLDFCKTTGHTFRSTPQRGCVCISITGKGSKLKKESRLKRKLALLNLLQNKHIPENYKINSKEVRLQLLAGLIDTDGCVNKLGKIEITLKPGKLVEDIKFLCNTLGYRVSINDKIAKIKSSGFSGTYKRIVISGEVQEIPLKIQRKRERQRRKTTNSLMTKVRVEYDGVGEYFGFQTDKDHLFLLEDCTVTHNSVFSECLVRGFFEHNDNDFDLLDFTWEMSPRVILVRNLSSDFQRSYKYICSADRNTITDDEMSDIALTLQEKYAKLPIYYVEKPDTTTGFADTVRRFRDKSKRKLVVRVDHTILARIAQYEGDRVTMLLNLLGKANEIKKESDVIFLFLTQLNREFEMRQENRSDKAFPQQSDTFGGDSTAMYSETMILLNMPQKYKVNYYGGSPHGIIVERSDLFAHIVKSRNAAPNLMIRFSEDFVNMSIKEN